MITTNEMSKKLFLKNLKELHSGNKELRLINIKVQWDLMTFDDRMSVIEEINQELEISINKDNEKIINMQKAVNQLLTI